MASVVSPSKVMEEMPVEDAERKHMHRLGSSQGVTARLKRGGRLVLQRGIAEVACGDGGDDGGIDCLLMLSGDER